MKKTLLCSLLTLSLAWTASAAVTRNDDSCDIAQLPAATLLLPYFEVDLDDPGGSTTLFSVTNVTNVDQIALLTLWTDRSYPVLSLNIYLTGYDVQAINLYDIIARGIVAPDAGTGTAIEDRGQYSDPNNSIQLAFCDRLPGQLDTQYIQRLQQAFTAGNVAGLGTLPACTGIGGVHANATGYATIDVVRECTDVLPSDPRYWTHEIGYANVLIGDYQHVERNTRFADGGPMIHIRAVPEGGLTPPLFPRTFYSRFQAPATPKLDARQPLPAVWAARWINGGPTGYRTSMKVWREGRTGAGAQCADFPQNATMEVQEIVAFDEAENAVASVVCPPEFPCGPKQLASTSLTSVENINVFPPIGNGATGGWYAMNLDLPGDAIASQAWVVASMRAEGQFSVDVDGVALGNGCSAPVGDSEIGTGSVTIGPLPNVRSQQ